MRTVQVALAQIAPRLGDVPANLRLHREAVAKARKKRAQVVVFPELSLTGYLLRDQVPDVAMTTASREFAEVAALSREVDLVVGFVEEGPGHLYFNAAAYLSKGRLVHVHRKIHLPTYGMFDEGRDFAGGDRLRPFDSRFGPAGILVCEDAWHPVNAWLLAHQGAEILYVSANGPTRGARPGKGVTSVAVWTDLLRFTAQFLTSYVVFTNRVGYEDGLAFGGGSTVVDPFGRILLTLPALEEGLEVVKLEDEVLRRARTAYPLLRDDDLELVGRELSRIRVLRYDLPEELDPPKPEKALTTAPDLEIDPELLTRILRGFLQAEVQRTGRSRVILGLSGGIDSAVVASLAVRAFGSEGVFGLLMPHSLSSADSVKHAELVVGRLGILAEKIDITPMAQAFVASTGDPGRLRLGNAMARIRMILLYDRSADLDALVLGTSNKTEILLGYSTLHGDMAAALQPLGDLYKTQVRQLAAYLRVPAVIRKKPPSADLWPKQSDEHDLGFTYESVDRLLALLVDARVSRASAIAAGFSPRFVHRVTRRIVRSQFKRKLPLIAKMSTRSVGWDFRYPRDWKS